ncbi:MAG: hypothetical protein INH37_15900, partial [Myxococcaceae bacterium]|nr:hypothetical protein [Myxococcaceae bacterium]
TLDENKLPVRDVFPDLKRVRITNNGRVLAKAKLSITGPDAATFELRVAGGDGGAFVKAAVPYELDVEALSSVEVQVAFSPRMSGAATAQLTIDDQVAETTMDPVISLVGTGLALPPQPTLETGVEYEDGGFSQCTLEALFGDCELTWPLVQFDTASTRRVVIRNRGCPALKVTSLKIVSDLRAMTPSQDFRLVSPPAPSSTSPLSLNKADGTEAIEATIEFKPVDTGPGNEVRSGYLIVDTNDLANMSPMQQPGVLGLRGEALRPALSATPTSCDFSRTSDLCGNTTKLPDRARFIVRNDGNGAVRISEVKFKSSGSASGGQNGRFSLASNPNGMTINPGSAITLEVTHSDMPTYVIDELSLKSVFVQGGAAAGDVSFALFGGRQPCLDTVDEVNFNNPMTPTSAQSFFIRNQRRFPDGGTDSSQCGTLIINQIGMDPSPFFSLIDPKIAANTPVPPGGMVETAIQYNKPPSGGMQVGKLKILTNDPFFGPPVGTKEINVISASPFDPPPQAVLKGCVPAMLINDPNCTVSGVEVQMTVNLSTITANPKTVRLSAFDSSDFDGMTMRKPAEFQFRLNNPIPAGATASNLSPNTRGTVDQATLTLPATGLYRVQLQVWDNRGQASQPVNLNINVLP